MLTPQEIQEKQFEKAVFGGYAADGVDTFLETVSESYSALFKENAILKSKLKVLVEKVEEYRSVDDVMRKTLLTAQQNAQNVTKEAERQAAEIIRGAEIASRSRTAEFRIETEREQARLDAAKSETIRFVTQLRELYRKEMELLSAIPEVPVEISPKAVRADKVESAVKDIDESIAARIAESEREISAESANGTPAAEDGVDKPAEAGAEDVPAVFEAEEESANDAPGDMKVFEVRLGDGSGGDFSDIWEPDEDTVVPRPRTDFNNVDLEFGPNYNPVGKKKKGG
ncbi:MAG: DivIVA domain-containing protein [Oscillospiraceae bacterium]|nr:DivIVA domain-containing protein [Oscillospiraceae bacterium]